MLFCLFNTELFFSKVLLAEMKLPRNRTVTSTHTSFALYACLEQDGFGFRAVYVDTGRSYRSVSSFLMAGELENRSELSSSEASAADGGQWLGASSACLCPFPASCCQLLIAADVRRWSLPPSASPAVGFLH